MSNGTSLIVALVAGVTLAGIGWFAVEAVNRRPFLGAIALFLWLAALALFIEHQEYFVQNVGGINVVVPDGLCAFLGSIAALRLVRGFARIAPGFRWPLLIFAGMLVLSYVRGVMDFGLQHATNEFREFFYFLTALAFALSFPFAQLGAKLPLAAVVGGIVLVAVATIRVAAMGGFQFEERSIPSYAALAIGQAFFLGWFWLRTARRSRFWRWVVFGFLPFCFLMLHRSVWVAEAGGLVVLLLLDRPGRGALLRTLLIGGLIGALGVGFIFGDKIVVGINQAFNEATSSESSTFLWRLEGWQALLRPEAGWNFSDVAAGRPMGSGYARTLGNSVVNTAEIESGVIPHNYYLSMLLRGGVIGTFAFLAFYLKLITCLVRRVPRENSPGWPACFVVILTTQLIYYVPYSADLIQGLLLGGAAALAATPSPSPSHESASA